MWLRQLEILGADHSALAIDLPGHGDSEDAGALDSVEKYTEFFAAFIERLDLRPFVLVGKGLGASVALHYGAIHTRQVRGLVLMGVAAKPEMPAELREVWAEAVREGAAQPAGPEHFSPATSVDVRSVVRREQERTTPEVRYRDLRAWTADDFRPRLSNVRQPVLVIAGADDRIVPAETSQDLCPQLPNARMEILEGAGHAAELEQAWAVAAKIDKFVRSLHREH